MLFRYRKTLVFKLFVPKGQDRFSSPTCITASECYMSDVISSSFDCSAWWCIFLHHLDLPYNTCNILKECVTRSSGMQLASNTLSDTFPQSSKQFTFLWFKSSSLFEVGQASLKKDVWFPSASLTCLACQPEPASPNRWRTQAGGAGGSGLTQWSYKMASLLDTIYMQF